VIHFDEFVEIDREHLESDHEVLPEHKLVHSPNDVLLVIWVLFIQVSDQLGLHKTLLVQPFLIF